MIFISHTKADKPLIEGLAEKLAHVFGKDKVFYDSWSIQPGDGIIKKMNEALSKCKFFFFFVSKKSLNSKMVELEWQNAILKATKSETSLIPIKIDDCLMPDVLLQTLYIDFFGLGPESALRQMIDVIEGNNTYRPGHHPRFQNIRAYLDSTENSLRIEFRAEAYMEPHSSYIILLENSDEDLSWKAIGESAYLQGFTKELKLDNGQSFSGITIGRDRATSPGFPFVVEIKAKEGKEICFRGAMREVSKGKFALVPSIEEKAIKSDDR